MKGTKKGTLKKIAWISAAVAVISLGIAAVLFFATDMGRPWESGKGIIIDEKRSFASGGIGKLEVRTSSTDVRITESQGNTVVAHLHGTVYTGQAEAVPALAAEQAGNVIGISTERQDGRRWVLGFFSSDLILEIEIPDNYRGALVVHTSSGDVEISGQILSELSVQTSSGSIQLHSIEAATAALKSSSGDQTAEGMNAGYSQMTSSSGEIRAKDLQGGARVESSSGDITLRYAEFDSDLEVLSSSGDVELFLTEAAEFRVEARASSGDIDCAFPVTLNGAGSEMSRNRLYGKVAEGTHRVAVRTSSGDITIRP